MREKKLRYECENSDIHPKSIIPRDDAGLLVPGLGTKIVLITERCGSLVSGGGLAGASQNSGRKPSATGKNLKSQRLELHWSWLLTMNGEVHPFPASKNTFRSGEGSHPCVLSFISTAGGNGCEIWCRRARAQEFHRAKFPGEQDLLMTARSDFGGFAGGSAGGGGRNAGLSTLLFTYRRESQRQLHRIPCVRDREISNSGGFTGPCFVQGVRWHRGNFAGGSCIDPVPFTCPTTDMDDSSVLAGIERNIKFIEQALLIL